MLTNNFRKLISFYTDVDFVNVQNQTVSKRMFLGGKGYNQDIKTSAPTVASTVSNSHTENGHDPLGQTHCFNYNGTNTTNNYTDEKESYTWATVLTSTSSSGSPTTAYSMWTYNGFVLFVGANNDTNNTDISTSSVTADDYCLNSAINMPVVNASCLHNAYEKTYVSRTFENNTANPIVVKEIGCYMFRSYYATFASQNSGKLPVVMIGRRILDIPITINPGEQKTFVYTIDMSHLLFSEIEGE